MIQINLLNQRPIIHGIPSGKDGVRLLVTVLVVVIFSAIATSLAIKSSKKEDMNGFTPFVSAPVETEENDVATVDKNPLADSVQSDEELDTLYTRYSVMNMAHRLTYEHLYSYYLFRELEKIVPADVNFTSISIKGFETVVGLGEIKSEAGTVALFSALKKKEWELEPKPASLFRELNGGYQFRFEGFYKLRPSIIDSLVITENSIPTQDHLQELKDIAMAIFGKSPVKTIGEFEAIDPLIEGKYFHYQYVVNGTSSFSQFKELLRNLKNSSSPISISDAELIASEAGLSWKVILRITVI